MRTVIALIFNRTILPLVISTICLSWTAPCLFSQCLVFGAQAGRPLKSPRLPSEERKGNITAPLLLVPGLLGSWTKDSELLYHDAQIADLKAWALTENVMGGVIAGVFTHSIRRLSQRGYTVDRDVIRAAYDWRQPITNHRAIMDWIDFAKAEFKLKWQKPAGKVDVIAHSLGGLIVRSYIQSNSYRDDIRKLAIVATPNFGSADAYFLWSGGIAPPQSNMFFAGFLNDALKKMNKLIDPQNGRAPVHFIQKHVLSLRDLLPVPVKDENNEGVSRPILPARPLGSLRTQFAADTAGKERLLAKQLER